MTATDLARLEGAAAAIVGAVLGDVLGRPVTGLPPAHATARLASSDASISIAAPPPAEDEPMREALPGTPSAATMLGLVLLEAAKLSPADAVEDVLRRVHGTGFARGRRQHGALTGPSPVVVKTLRDFAASTHALSCAGDAPDATMLLPALMLGACGTPLERAALLLRAVNRNPITLSAAVTLSEVTRSVVARETTPESLLRAARQSEERVLASLRALPGTLAGPPEMGHGAMAMSLARAQSAQSGTEALLPLSHDASAAPEIVLSSVLGALATEPAQLARQVALVLRHGGAAFAAAGVLVGLHGALMGLRDVPLGWMAALRHAAPLLAFARAAVGDERLPFPAADLNWAWARDEFAFRDERDTARRTSVVPGRSVQLGLFGELASKGGR
ncbi:MAG: ADP-ribosylglycohydrolase family protein [Deltaproteobacteria bacterium]|nr:ADP-ribosylglycohydrolase family protein [Deltaproteobacteria bacterium]